MDEGQFQEVPALSVVIIEPIEQEAVALVLDD